MVLALLLSRSAGLTFVSHSGGRYTEDDLELNLYHYVQTAHQKFPNVFILPTEACEGQTPQTFFDSHLLAVSSAKHPPLSFFRCCISSFLFALSIARSSFPDFLVPFLIQASCPGRWGPSWVSGVGPRDTPTTLFRYHPCCPCPPPLGIEQAPTLFHSLLLWATV